jgi:hypothetical protein
MLDVFNHLNEGAGNDPLNDTAHLKRTLEEKMKAREQMKKQIITEQSKVVQFFGGLQVNHFVFLMVMGSLGAISAYAIDLTVFEVNSSKIN